MYIKHNLGCRPPSGAGAAGDSDEDEDDEDGDPYLLPITHEVSLQCAQLAVSDTCPRHALLSGTAHKEVRNQLCGQLSKGALRATGRLVSKVLDTDLTAAACASAAHGKCVTAIAADRAGARLLTGGEDYQLQMFDFGGMKRDMRSFRKLEPMEGYPINALSFSPSGAPP
jgi:hypothetical protein